MKEKLIRQLAQYSPFNEQETADREIILKALREQDDIFERSNLTAHMTASAWTVDRTRSRILMVYHNIYDSWSWLGGHADGDCDLLSVALREVREESGIWSVRPVTEDIFSVEVLPVFGHEKRGEYVPSHLHLNVTYLIEGDSSETVRINADENSGVAWFDISEAVQKSSEPWFREHIYSKLNRKLESFR